MSTFGLGENVPIATGNMSVAYFALVDDPAAGWKGKAGWATYSTRAVFHVEGGKENRPRVVKFQLRPDPLAN